jgi:hypothetical protein
VTKLHWPGQELLTHVLYRASALAQKVNEAIGQNGEQINCQTQLARDEAKAGRASMTHCPVDLGHVWLVTYTDVSLGRKQWYRPQAGLTALVTDERALKQEIGTDRVEHQNKQISQVVKSHLAAEPASLPMAADKHLYAQVLRHAPGHGEGSIGADWRNDFSVSSYEVTDARAPYDHDTTTGSMPAERAWHMVLPSSTWSEARSALSRLAQMQSENSTRLLSEQPNVNAAGSTFSRPRHVFLRMWSTVGRNPSRDSSRKSVYAHLT